MKTKRWLRPTVIFVVSIAIIGFIFVVLPVCLELATQAALLPGVEHRVGAQILSPWVQAGETLDEVMTFANVIPNGACAQAGISSGDIIVSDATIGELCKRLNGNTGQRVVVEVVDGGHGPAVEERPRRQVVIVLP